MNLSKIKTLLANKKFLFMGTTFFLLTMILVTVFANKEVILKLDESEVTHSFRGKQTVGEILEAKNVSLKEEDKVEPSLDTVLKDGDEITVIKAVPVTINADNKEYNFLSTETEVQKILEKLNIKIGNLDIVEPNIHSTIDPDEKHIDIVRVVEKYESDTAVLKYKDIVKKNSKMDKGTTKLVQRGSNGLKQIKEKVILHDGVEASREVVEETITKKPVDQVKEVGTNTLIATSRGNMNFTKVMYVEATAYYQGSRTASGTTPTENRTIAASRSFSFGTKMYIPRFNNASNGGVFIVEDRGGAIQGNKIDIYFNSKSEAVSFGRRTLKVYVL